MKQEMKQKMKQKMKHKKKEELDGKWKKVATQAVTQDDFKWKLKENPIEELGKFDLHVPEGVEVKIGTGGIFTLVPPPDVSDEITDEIQWWRWRLDMIAEFGRADKETGVNLTAPASEEGV